MKIAILSLSGQGPLNTMLSLAMKLEESGFIVEIVGIEDMRELVSHTSLKFISVGEKEFPKDSSRKYLSILSKKQGLCALIITANMIAKWADVMLKNAPPTLIERKYDLIIANQGVPEAETLSKVTKIPFITVCSAALFNQELGVPPVFTTWLPSTNIFLKIRNFFAFGLQGLLSINVALVLRKYRKKYALKPYRSINEAFSPILQISQFPKSFEFKRQCLPKHFYFLGPFHRDENRKSIDFDYSIFDKKGKTFVYASLGSLQVNQEKIYQTICNYFLETDYILILSF